MIWYKMKDTYSHVKRQKLTAIAIVKNGKNSNNAANLKFEILHMASTYKITCTGQLIRPTNNVTPVSTYGSKSHYLSLV